MSANEFSWREEEEKRGERRLINHPCIWGTVINKVRVAKENSARLFKKIHA